MTECSDQVGSVEITYGLPSRSLRHANWVIMPYLNITAEGKQNFARTPVKQWSQVDISKFVFICTTILRLTLDKYWPRALHVVFATSDPSIKAPSLQRFFCRLAQTQTSNSKIIIGNNWAKEFSGNVHFLFAISFKRASEEDTMVLEFDWHQGAISAGYDWRLWHDIIKRPWITARKLCWKFPKVHVL